jgi:hypothetical protein
MRLDAIAVCYMQNESTGSPVDFDRLHCQRCVYHLRPVMMNFLGARNTRHINRRASNSRRPLNLDADSRVPMTLVTARR